LKWIRRCADAAQAEIVNLRKYLQKCENRLEVLQAQLEQEPSDEIRTMENSRKVGRTFESRAAN
jgi:hypothetical protein